jgi:two-component system, NarL family, sensor histidine kinase NreB
LKGGNKVERNDPFIKGGYKDATILVNDQGIISYGNQQACENFGYIEKELIGKKFSELMPEANLWDTEQGKVIHQYGKSRDGRTFSLFFRLNTFNLGGTFFFLIIFHNVKDQSRLNKNQSYPLNEFVDLNFALDESTIVAITDEKGKITYVNEKFCEVSKYSAKELIGKDHRIINSGYHSMDFMRNLWSTISSGRIFRGEIKNKAKDGTYYWVDTTIVPFLDETGKPYKYLAIRHEITQRKNAEQELKKMMTKIIDVQEDERRRISRELHDGIGQNLYSHLITINRLQSEISHPLLDQMQDETTKLIEELRDLSWELRPSVLDDLGLIPAIRSYLVRFSEHTHIDVHFDCYLKSRLHSSKEVTIYRIIQEALTNIRKYAKTEKASVTIREMDEEIRIVIEDSGKGFDMNRISQGVGLFSMEERTKAVGGTLTIYSVQEGGTKIILEVPM